ncbi:MAG: ABC transporter substrate-binding protein [Coriobacteriales bacterium]|jgi:iron complex transport system substrate-binding protein|nr:ABC transporter substrate-binding protein [Coriobacteriales bacterium]
MTVSFRKKVATLLGAGALSLCLASTMLVGCANEPAANDGEDQTPVEEAATPSEYSFTDDLGKEVTVNNPQKVVACMGSFANIWTISGGTLIGATSDAFEDYGLDAANIAEVGYFTDPNLEQIIALEPDFVIMTGASTGRDGSASQVDLRDALKDAGAEVAYFNVTTFEDYLKMLRTCCNITARDDLYEQNGTAVEAQIADIKAKAAAAEGEPTVLLMTTFSGGTRVQNSETMSGAMLAEMGAKNLADETPSLLRDFSLEAVIELNPDFILVVPMGNDDAAAMRNLEEATAANPAWATLDAVQNNRYITLDKTLFLFKPNANWEKSYEKLFEILYS